MTGFHKFRNETVQQNCAKTAQRSSCKILEVGQKRFGCGFKLGEKARSKGKNGSDTRAYRPSNTPETGKLLCFLNFFHTHITHLNSIILQARIPSGSRPDPTARRPGRQDWRTQIQRVNRAERAPRQSDPRQSELRRSPRRGAVAPF